MQNALESKTVREVLTILRRQGLIRAHPIHLVGGEVVAVLDVRRGTASTELVEAIHAVDPELDPALAKVIDHSISEARDGQLLFRCQLSPTVGMAG